MTPFSADADDSEVPFDNPGVLLHNPEVPLDNPDVPLNNLGVPLDNPDVPLNNPDAPLGNEGVLTAAQYTVNTCVIVQYIGLGRYRSRLVLPFLLLFVVVFLGGVVIAVVLNLLFTSRPILVTCIKKSPVNWL